MSTLSDFAEGLLDETREEINRADTKANILLAAAGVVLAVIVGGLLSGQIKLARESVPVQILAATSSASMAIGLAFLGAAVVPRVGQPRPGRAQYFMDHAQNPQAAEQYEQVLKVFPANVDALNNLAWVYTEQHDPRALALAEKAHKLAPTSPGIMDTYGWALLAQNQSTAALPILQKAAKAAPKVPTIQYHLAVAQARTGDKSGALGTLQALLKSNVSFAESPDARKLYEQLGGGAQSTGG